MKKSSSLKRKFLFTAGSTGGHIFPALAVAGELKKKGHNVHIVTSAGGMEKNILQSSSFSFSVLSVGRLRKGVGLSERVKTFFSLPIYILRALFFIFRFQPDAVIGTGGAVCGPVLLAVKLLRRRAVIWELNAAAGLTNKILSRFVDFIFISFEETRKCFPKKKCVFFSLPVRKEIFEEGIKPREPDGYFHLLVLGGSQGSRKINQVVLDMCHKEKLETWRIRHQTGEKDFPAVQKIYAGNESVQCQPFFNNMGQCYRWADVVVSRAGAGVLSELSACGKAVVVIPLASAPDQHQLKNALALEKMSAVKLLREKNLNARSLFEAIMRINGKEKRQLEENIKKFYSPQSMEKLIHFLENLDA